MFNLHGSREFACAIDEAGSYTAKVVYARGTLPNSTRINSPTHCCCGAPALVYFEIPNDQMDACRECTVSDPV